RPVLPLQHERPAPAAVLGLVKAALRAVAPEPARDAGVDDVAVARIDDDARDPLRFRKAHVRPALAGVGRAVDAVAHRDGVARPRPPLPAPPGGRGPGVIGYRTDRLPRFLVEPGLDRRPAADRLPAPPAGRPHVERRLPAVVARGHRRDAAAHRGRADVAG